MLKHDKPKEKNGCLQGIKRLSLLRQQLQTAGGTSCTLDYGPAAKCTQNPTKNTCASQKLLLLMSDQSHS